TRLPTGVPSPVTPAHQEQIHVVWWSHHTDAGGSAVSPGRSASSSRTSRRCPAHQGDLLSVFVGGEEPGVVDQWDWEQGPVGSVGRGTGSPLAAGPLAEFIGRTLGVAPACCGAPRRIGRGAA